MPKIFVANRSYHDYSDAERFGELVYLTDGSLRSYSVSQMYRIAEEHLTNSEPDDVILISGLSAFNAVLSAFFGKLHGRLNILIYKNRRSGPGRYIYREIVLPSEEN